MIKSVVSVVSVVSGAIVVAWSLRGHCDLVYGCDFVLHLLSFGEPCPAVMEEFPGVASEFRTWHVGDVETAAATAAVSPGGFLALRRYSGLKQQHKVLAEIAHGVYGAHGHNLAACIW